MAWRNLVSRKRRSGLSFMTIFSILGVAIGVATLIIVLSVMAGFEADLRKKMLTGEPHVEIFAENAAAGLSLKEFSLEQIEKKVPEAVTIEPFTKSDVVLKHRKHLQSAELIGIDPSHENELWVFSRSLVEGSLDDLASKHAPIISEDGGDHRWPGIILGVGLAGNLGVDIGDEIIIINPAIATDSSLAMTAETTTRHYVVVGLFHSQIFNFDNKWAVVNLSEGRRFMAEYDYTLEEDQYVSGIAINLKDPYKSETVVDRIKKLGQLQPVSWQTSNKSLLFALKLEKFAMGSILMLIVLVAAFSISGTMMMTVFHKRTQISLLRAIGMNRLGILKLYLYHGLAIGLVGTLFGLLLGLGACFLIYNFHFIHLPRGVYLIKALPVRFVPEAYVIICTAASLFSLIASAYPAYTAAKQNPSAGLRYE